MTGRSSVAVMLQCCPSCAMLDRPLLRLLKKSTRLIHISFFDDRATPNRWFDIQNGARAGVCFFRSLWVPAFDRWPAAKRRRWFFIARNPSYKQTRGVAVAALQHGSLLLQLLPRRRSIQCYHTGKLLGTAVAVYYYRPDVKSRSVQRPQTTNH